MRAGFGFRESLTVAMRGKGFFTGAFEALLKDDF